MVAILENEQKNAISEWIQQGKSLAEVQEQLQKQFGASITFMELRFLVDDLDLKLQDQENKVSATTDLNKVPDPSNASEFADAADIPNGGQTSVTVDKVQRPGAMLSGSVTFANGKTLAWQLDQVGRLGIIPGKDDYRPNETELAEFQSTLQEELKKHGY